MEPKNVIQIAGQEVQKSDIERIAENAAHADDRLLAELLRIRANPSSPQKAVLPYGVSGHAAHGALNSTAGVQSSGTADGKVRVMPFRAVLGTRDVTGLDATRGIRTQLFAPAPSGQLVQIAANASASPRWTLIYAAVTPDDDDIIADRYVKDIGTGVVTQQNLVITKSTKAEVLALDGTPAATPAKPGLPSDAAGTYYIALAYIWVPGSFTIVTQIDRKWIHECAPTVPVHASLGAVSCAPANQSHVPGGTVDLRQEPTNARAGAYLPSTMVGGEERIILLQLARPDLSHNDGDVVDDSVDWRFRFFQWTATSKAGTTSTSGFASDRSATGVGPVPNATSLMVATGLGQSFTDDSSVPNAGLDPDITDGNGVVVYLTSSHLAEIDPADFVVLYVRDSDGALMVRYAGATPGQFFLWLRATAPFSNYGVVV